MEKNFACPLMYREKLWTQGRVKKREPKALSPLALNSYAK
ncbi:hypothetical protein KKC1_11700 [Calderihabitans maritimus]|uniref:Uncharacterized protein n=1 Tax=Calderihabitans maritimus TaxID=1246530 RepID=A0A1Z5HRW2_9FIRM|nr:hypothetical protein KKC1_11700 [Calderihabitans maritimus]